MVALLVDQHLGLRDRQAGHLGVCDVPFMFMLGLLFFFEGAYLSLGQKVHWKPVRLEDVAGKILGHVCAEPKRPLLLSQSLGRFTLRLPSLLRTLTDSPLNISLSNLSRSTLPVLSVLPQRCRLLCALLLLLACFA